MTEQDWHDKIRECLLALQTHPGEKIWIPKVAEWLRAKYPEEAERESAAQNLTHKNPRGAQRALTYVIRVSRKRIKGVASETIANRIHLWLVGEEHQQAQPAPKARAQSSVASRTKGIPAEVHLYEKLDSFLRSDNHGFKSWRIDEKKASNKGGHRANRWLFPDVVGREDLSRAHNWEHNIKQCVKQYGDKRVKLWSFEVKREITRSNVREHFFQAVSNSSWANYGYLVAVEISIEAKKELQILSALHGIGLIRLDFDAPQNSRVEIPARARVDVDWNTATRIAKENKDFEKYIEDIYKFLHNWAV